MSKCEQIRDTCCVSLKHIFTRPYSMAAVCIYQNHKVQARRLIHVNPFHICQPGFIYRTCTSAGGQKKKRNKRKCLQGLNHIDPCSVCLAHKKRGHDLAQKANKPATAIPNT